MYSQVEFLELMRMAGQHMEEQGFSYTSVYCYLRTWRSVYNFALSRGIAHYNAELAELYMREKYRMAIGENYVDQSVLSPYLVQKIRAIRALTDFKLHGFIPKLTRAEAIDWPEDYREVCEAFLAEYKALGYSSGSNRRHELNLCRFVNFLASQGLGPSGIKAEHLFAYFKSLCHFSKPQIAVIRVTIHKVLRYFSDRGLCSESLADCIPRVNYHARTKLDKTWTDEEVARMLKAIDCSNPTGKRDYCIMAIAANLGLRTGDILNLTIDDIDWRNGTINIIQQKTGEPLALPLLEHIGKAVIDYWQNGRPVTIAREVFVQHTLPYQKLSKGMAYHMFNKYFGSTGMKVLEGRKHGLHSLRHSLASRLLEKDTPISVIGNILGHVDSNSASHYIRIDIDKLRTCALEVPDYE
jgi:integrase